MYVKLAVEKKSKIVCRFEQRTWSNENKTKFVNISALQAKTQLVLYFKIFVFMRIFWSMSFQNIAVYFVASIRRLKAT
jgi:hypothetical protein